MTRSVRNAATRAERIGARKGLAHRRVHSSQRAARPSDDGQNDFPTLGGNPGREHALPGSLGRGRHEK